MQARRLKALLQTSILVILPVALIPGPITAAETAGTEAAATTSGTEATATESSPGAWDATKHQFVELPPETYQKQVLEGLKIARKQIAPDLLVVPVAAPTRAMQ
jgi:hypothetical protein